jgi:hypothetical protein
MAKDIVVTLTRPDAEAILEALQWSLRRFEEAHLADPVASKELKASAHPIYQDRARLIQILKNALT